MAALRIAVLGQSPLTTARLAAIRSHPDAELAGSWTLAAARKLGPEKLETLVAETPADVIALDLPGDLAPRAALAALNAGRHVLSTLPGARSVEDIVNLREAEQRSGKQLKFGSSLRYHQSVREAHRHMATGKFGDLLTARAVYGHTGLPDAEAEASGILLGHGIHMIDLLHLFCGPFETCKAMRDTDEAPESNLFAILKSGTGTLAQLHASATSWRQTFRLELGFESGYLWLDGHLPGLKGYGPEVLVHAMLERDGRGRPIANPPENIVEYDTAPSGAAEIEELLAAISGTSPLANGTSHQAFDAMNIAQRICAAAERWA